MLHWIRTACVPSLGLIIAIAGSQAARAVVLTGGTTPHVYAVSYLNEEWAEAPGAGGLFGYFDNTDQMEGTDAAASFQQEGIDANPFGSCTPPCSGMTAEAEARYVGGGVVLSGLSHTYANFDRYLTIGEPGNLFYLSAYNSGNIVRAESNATVLDRLTITQPVQLDLQGHVSGNIGMTISSAAEILDITGADFGSGKADANLNISLVSTPIASTVLYPVSLSLNGFDPSTPQDQDFAATTQTLLPGDYLLKAEFRTATRIGTVSRPNLAVQDMHSDFGPTVTFRIVSDVPSAVTSASGLLTFAPEPSAETLAAVAASGLALLAHRRRA
jgi:hypothetical protein